MIGSPLHRVMGLSAVACALLTLGCAPAGTDNAPVDKPVATTESATTESATTKSATTKPADEATRIEAIESLGTLGDVAAVPELEKHCQADSPVVRAYAARALGSIGPAAKGAAECLIVLLADPDDSVRRQAIDALAAIRPGPKVALPLFVKLMQDSDPGVRMRVLQAVADAKADAVPAMVEALNNDASAYWACIVLRDIGPDAVGAVPALVEKLGDPRPEIRREATLALAAIGSPEAVPKIVPLLDDELSRTPATYALGVLGEIPENAESTIRANIESDDKLLRTVSLWALARVHPDDLELKREALTQLVARLKDENPFVRTAAARALAALPPSPEIAGPIFEEALADADETTTHYMLDAIAAQGEQAVPRLIAALEYESLREQVAYILGQIGPAAAPATDALAKLVADEDPNVSTEAAFALAKIGPGAKAGVPALVEALKRGEGRQTHAAAFALGSIGPDAAAAEPALLEVIEGSDNSISLICAWSLVQIQGPSPEVASKVLPELIAGLDSPLPRSRQGAAETLGRLGSLAKNATPQLQHATEDDDEDVRKAAREALEAIGG